MTKEGLVPKWPVFERLTTTGRSVRNLLLRKELHVNKRKSGEFQEDDSFQMGKSREKTGLWMLTTRAALLLRGAWPVDPELSNLSV